MQQATYAPGPRTDDAGYADADLVAQLRAGDEAAMSQLVGSVVADHAPRRAVVR